MDSSKLVSQIQKQVHKNDAISEESAELMRFRLRCDDNVSESVHSSEGEGSRTRNCRSILYSIKNVAAKSKRQKQFDTVSCGVGICCPYQPNRSQTCKISSDGMDFPNRPVEFGLSPIRIRRKPSLSILAVSVLTILLSISHDESLFNHDRSWSLSPFKTAHASLIVGDSAIEIQEIDSAGHHPDNSDNQNQPSVILGTSIPSDQSSATEVGKLSATQEQQSMKKYRHENSMPGPLPPISGLKSGDPHQNNMDTSVEKDRLNPNEIRHEGKTIAGKVVDFELTPAGGHNKAKIKKKKKKKKKEEEGMFKKWAKKKNEEKKFHEKKVKESMKKKKEEGKKKKKKWGHEEHGLKKKGKFKKKKWGEKVKKGKGVKKGKKGKKFLKDKGHKNTGFKTVYHKEEWGKSSKWHDIKREKKWDEKSKKWKNKWKKEKGKKYKGDHMKKFEKKKKEGKKYKKEKKEKHKKFKMEKEEKGKKKKMEEHGKKKEGGKKSEMKKKKKKKKMK